MYVNCLQYENNLFKYKTRGKGGKIIHSWRYVLLIIISTTIVQGDTKGRPLLNYYMFSLHAKTGNARNKANFKQMTIATIELQSKQEASCRAKSC